MKLNLTNAGINVLLRALAGDRIIFTRVQIGNGASQAPATADALSNPLLELPIQAIEVSATNATLQTRFNNNTVEAGFRHTETGIWVQSPEDASTEVLYAYGTQPEDKADYISASGDAILETQMDFLIFIGGATNVSAIISESLVYASAADLKAHMEDTANPHRVTKNQVGLGNVPNVFTNDQTPTFSATAQLVTLQSGDRLSALFGKVARAVVELISHLKNVANPHKVTAAQIGAAPSAHKHTVTDITSGTLSTARGGTGKTSWSANRLVYASSASMLSQIAPPAYDGGFLRQDTSGAPYWGSGCETGVYIGSGRTGKSKKNAISFGGGTPRIVFIQQSGYNGRHAVLLLHPDSPVGYSMVDSSTSNLVVSISGKTVYWYYDSTDSHPANQMDVNNAKYVYVGVF